MQVRYRAACIAAAAITVSVTVLRVLGGGFYTAAILLMFAALAAVFLLCGATPRQPREVSGRLTVPLSAVTAFGGMAMILGALSQALGLLRGSYPYPQPISLTVAHKVLLVIMIVGGVAGGLFLAVTAVRWLFGHKTDRGFFVGITLLPVVWMWGRVVWYLISFASAANRFTGLTELLLLLFEMLFLLNFARFVSGVENKPPRFDMAIALGTALLGVTVFFTRCLSYLTQNGELFSATELFTASDFYIALLAAVWTVDQMFGGGKVAPPLPMEEEEEEEEEPRFTEEDQAYFVLDEEALREEVVGDEEIEENSEEERRPLELEDILNEYLK